MRARSSHSRPSPASQTPAQTTPPHQALDAIRTAWVCELANYTDNQPAPGSRKVWQGWDLKNNQAGIKHRGGKRNGAGRPKGSPNKASIARQAKVEASGLTPLDYMLGILRDENADAAQRFEAAKHAAPYVHPKLSSVAVGGDDEAGPIRHTVEWLPSE